MAMKSPGLTPLAIKVRAMTGEPGIFALAVEGNGIDGTEDAAGAFVTPDTRTGRARRSLTRGLILSHMTATVSSPV